MEGKVEAIECKNHLSGHPDSLGKVVVSFGDLKNPRFQMVAPYSREQ